VEGVRSRFQESHVVKEPQPALRGGKLLAEAAVGGMGGGGEASLREI
jgi:hypothetical protein